MKDEMLTFDNNISRKSKKMNLWCNVKKNPKNNK